MQVQQSQFCNTLAVAAGSSLSEVSGTTSLYNGDWLQSLCSHNTLMSGLTNAELATMGTLEIDQMTYALLNPTPKAPLTCQITPRRVNILMKRIKSLRNPQVQLYSPQVNNFRSLCILKTEKVLFRFSSNMAPKGFMIFSKALCSPMLTSVSLRVVFCQNQRFLYLRVDILPQKWVCWISKMTLS